ncbi:uncharacterized protein J3R85_018462 [Psidium guajava]|nr:uncharacterized protein J3R85_018462 [Psidium guajava]
MPSSGSVGNSSLKRLTNGDSTRDRLFAQIETQDPGHLRTSRRSMNRRFDPTVLAWKTGGMKTRLFLSSSKRDIWSTLRHWAEAEEALATWEKMEMVDIARRSHKMIERFIGRRRRRGREEGAAKREPTETKSTLGGGGVVQRKCNLVPI